MLQELFNYTRSLFIIIVIHILHARQRVILRVRHKLKKNFVKTLGGQKYFVG